MKFKWGTSPDFAEMAEALTIDTGQVVLAKFDKDADEIVVLYTPDPDGELPVWRAVLARDADDILVVKGEPFEIPGPPT